VKNCTQGLAHVNKYLIVVSKCCYRDCENNVSSSWTQSSFTHTFQLLGF